MRMSRIIDLFIGGLIVAGLIMLLAPAAFAGDDDCRGHSCNDGGDVEVDVDVGGDNIDITGGDVTVPVNTEVNAGDVNVQHKSESLGIGLSNSLGDVDIAGCLGSTQWATPLFSKQKLVVNWPCLTEFYIRNGMWENAAMAICNTEVRKEFDTEQDCRAAHPFRMMAVPAAAAVEESRDEEDERDRQQEELIAKQQAYLSELEQRLEKIETRPASRPQTVIQRESFLDDEKRAALEQLRGQK